MKPKTFLIKACSEIHNKHILMDNEQKTVVLRLDLHPVLCIVCQVNTSVTKPTL